MPLRFTIRDLLWLTAYVAISAGLFRLGASSYPPANFISYLFGLIFAGGALIYFVMIIMGATDKP